MTGEKLSSIWVANMDITYWSVRSSSRSGGDGHLSTDFKLKNYNIKPDSI